MLKHFKYLAYILKHKWYVFLGGLKVKASWWLLLTHDLSKLRPSEWFAYANFFYGASQKNITRHYSNGRTEKVKPPKDDQLGNSSFNEQPKARKLAFDIAWCKHQKRNPHHWQYWLLIEDENWWSLHCHNDPVGPFQIAQNDKPFGFYIDIPIDQTKANSKQYHELKRLQDCLNARPLPLPMPEKYIREMVADWIGAGWAITGKSDGVFSWYEKEKDRILLHPETRKRVEEILESLH